MTEEQQGGTTPEAESDAPTNDEAPEHAAGAVAVAEVPATADGTDNHQSEDPTAVAVTAPETADSAAGDATGAAAAESVTAVAPATSSLLTRRCLPPRSWQMPP